MCIGLQPPAKTHAFVSLEVFGFFGGCCSPCIQLVRSVLAPLCCKPIALNRQRLLWGWLRQHFERSQGNTSTGCMGRIPRFNIVRDTVHIRGLARIGKWLEWDCYDTTMLKGRNGRNNEEIIRSVMEQKRRGTKNAGRLGKMNRRY